MGPSSASPSPLLLWTSRQAAWAVLRWLSAAAIPITLLALYFTYSRGGLLALLVACVCLIALSAGPALAAGDAGDRRPRGAAGGARRTERATASPTTSAPRRQSTEGVTVLLVLLAGSRPLAAALRGTALGGAPRGQADRPCGGDLAQSTGAERDRPDRGPAGDRRRDRGRRARLGPVHRARTSSSPSNPQEHFSDLSGAGRHDFYKVADRSLRGKAAARPRRRHLPVLLESAARRADIPVHDAHSLYLESFAELGAVGGPARARPGRLAALVRLRRLAQRATAAARALRGPARRDARLCDQRRLRLVLGNRRARRGLLPRRRRRRRRPLQPDRRRSTSRRRGLEGRRTALRLDRRRPWSWPGSRRSR